MQQHKQVTKTLDTFKLFKRLGSTIGNVLLIAKIKIKWLQDKRCLPLTFEHYELYYIIHRLCWRVLGEFPNLVNCRDFNDRMQWLKLFDQDLEIIRCSDKVLVREYISERVGEKYLVNLYQKHDHFSEIDFAALPNSFVIKTNHDSGTVILVKDKSKLNYQMAETCIESALKMPYGWMNGEWAYSFIEPKVIIEEFIEPQIQTPPPDYKFFCVDGVVKFCHFIYDRGLDTKEQIVDPKGCDMSSELYPAFKLGRGFIKPLQWDRMVSVAERLSEGFKFVRVDLYCTTDRIYAGEMTFWPMAGLYKGEGQKNLGELLDFNRNTFKPLLFQLLEKNRMRFRFYPDFKG